MSSCSSSVVHDMKRLRTILWKCTSNTEMIERLTQMIVFYDHDGPRRIDAQDQDDMTLMTSVAKGLQVQVPSLDRDWVPATMLKATKFLKSKEVLVGSASIFLLPCLSDDCV